MTDEPPPLPLPTLDEPPDEDEPPEEDEPPFEDEPPLGPQSALFELLDELPLAPCEDDEPFDDDELLEDDEPLDDDELLEDDPPFELQAAFAEAEKLLDVEPEPDELPELLEPPTEDAPDAPPTDLVIVLLP